MKKFGILPYLCVLMLLVTTLSYAQDLNAIQQKMLELQTYYMSALQFQQQKEFLKAAREYEKAGLVQYEILNLSQGFPDMQKTMIFAIIDTTTNAAYCYQNAHDLEKAKGYYDKAFELAEKCQYQERMFEIGYYYAAMYRDSYNFNDFAAILVRFNNELKSVNAIKAVDQLLEMSADPKECVWKISALNRYRNLTMDYLQFVYDSNKYDEVLKGLEDKEFLQIQSELNKINLEQLDRLCQRYRQSNKPLTPEVLVLFFTLNMDNTVQKFLAITQKGMCCRGKGEYDKAFSAFDEAGQVINSIDREKQKKLIDTIYGEIKATVNTLKPENQAAVQNVFENFKEDDMAELISILYINNKYHRARTYQKTNDHTRALEIFNEIRKECEKLPYYKLYILPKIEISMAESYYSIKAYDKAQQSAEAAREGFRKTPSHNNLNITWKIDTLKGKLLEARGDRGGSLAAYESAMKSVENLKTMLLIYGKSEEFFGERTEPFEGSIRMLTETGRPIEALQVAEKVKARSLSQWLGPLVTMKELAKKPVDPARRKKYEAMAERYYALCHEGSSYLAELQGMANSNKPVNTEKATELVNKLMKCATDAMEIELSILIEIYPGIVEIKKAEQIIPPGEAQKLLDGETVVFEYFCDSATEKARQRAYLWVLTSDSVEEFPLSISPAELDNKVREFRKCIAQNSQSWKEQAAELYEALIKPGEKLLAGKKRLLVIPHKSLHYLPFAALIDGQGAPLAKNYSLVSEPSLNAFKICHSQKSIQGDDLVVFALGNATPEGGLSPLPGTLTEAGDIKKIFSKATIVKENDFKKDTIPDSLKNKELVHFATHGIVDADKPYESGLATSSSKYTIADILKEAFSDLKFNLITLSACNTGIGKLFPGDDQVGMTRAFMFAGTPSVLSSLWSVSDESTAKLMTHFYENLHENMDKGEALREAELKLMDEYPHPFYWAPFVLSGDWK